MQQTILSLANKVKSSLGDVIHLLSQKHNDQMVIALTRKFILTSTSSDIMKHGLEFLYMHGFYEDLQLLIKKNSESANASNQKWAGIYQLMIDRRGKQYNPQALLTQLNSIKTDEPELICLVECMKVSVYFDLHAYDRVGNFLLKQPYLFEVIEDDFLLHTFHIRLYQHLFIYYWIRNELIMARKYAYRALNKTTSAKITASLHNNLGLTYVFDTYYQGMYHLSKALRIARNNNLTHLIYLLEQSSIPFLSAHFNQTEGIESLISNEQAHIEIAKGNYSKAVKILSDLPMNDPYTLYCMGIATKDKHVLTQSYNCFIEKESNYFFSRLPLKALQRIGG